MKNNKSLILAFSLVAGLMSTSALAAEFGASSNVNGLNKEVTPIVINGKQDFAIWDSGGTAEDSKEKFGDKVSDIAPDNLGGDSAKGDDAGESSGSTAVFDYKPKPDDFRGDKATTDAAGDALVAAILTAGPKDVADTKAESMPVFETKLDRYDPVATAAVAVSTDKVDTVAMDKVDVSRVDKIAPVTEFVEYSKADTASLDTKISRTDYVQPVVDAKMERVDKFDHVDKVSLAKEVVPVVAVVDAKFEKIDTAQSRVMEQKAVVDLAALEKARIAERLKLEYLAKVEEKAKLEDLARLKEDILAKDKLVEDKRVEEKVEERVEMKMDGRPAG